MPVSKARIPGLDDPVMHLARLHSGEGAVKWMAVLLAFVLHITVLLVPLPEIKRSMTPKPRAKVVMVRKYIPPPPPLERPRTVQKKLTRKMPLPDPTPEEPEPIREPEPEIVPDPLPTDVEFLIGEPEAPPAPGPLMAGIGGVTYPVRIEESYVQPLYPDMARIARIESKVVLQALVKRDGAVGQITVLRCDHPGMGFEEEAIKAVNEWRYTPATQNGRPVEVYFTVVVDFELR